MNRLIAAVFICMLFFACSKNNTAGQEAIVGKWELRESDGGFVGTIKYQPGNGNQLKFDDKNGFQSFYAGVISYSGTYEITKSALAGDWLLQLHYIINNQPATQKDSVRFNASALIFLPVASCCDIPTISYERIFF